MSNSYVVREEPTGLWVADCVDDRRGCVYGGLIGTYDTERAAKQAESAHLRWHRSLDSADEQERLEEIRRLARIVEWRHSSICEKYAVFSVRDCLCGLAEWQAWFLRHGRPERVLHP